MVGNLRKNKRGWLRIVEATVAILIIFSVLIVIAERKKTQTEKDLTEVINPLLDEIAKDSSLRDKIIIDSESSNEAENLIMSFLGARIKESYLNYTIKICDYTVPCGLDEIPSDLGGNLYAGTRIISSSLTVNKPKKIALFMWAKG